MSTFFLEHAKALIGIPLTLFLNALLVACELSLIKIRFSHFNPDLKERLEAHKFLSKLFVSGDRSIRVIRLGLSACLLLYGLLAYPLLQGLIAEWEVQLWHNATALSAIFAFLTALSLHHLVGELVPRGFGLAYPLQSLKLGSLLIAVWGWLTKPIRVTLLGLVRFCWQIWKREPLPDLDSLDLEAQIELLRTEAPEMSTVAQLILKNALLMRDLVVADVLLPRNQVKYFDLNLPLEENLQMAKESGHTRFPLCFGDLDRCLGLIHIKDIFRFPGGLGGIDLRRIKRNMIRIDSEEPLEQALTKLLSHRIHMALVIDEFRGTEGVLTLERILEQLVGEIRDEFDAEEEALIRPESEDGEAVVSGLTPIHEIEAKFNLQFENDEVSTLSGLITSELGRIPDKGEILQVNFLQIEITEVEETRVVEARIKRVELREDEDSSVEH